MLLGVIGVSPVSSLLTGETNVDVEAALRSIHTSSMAIQERGWDWNTDGDEADAPYFLDPDPTTGEIVLPANALKCDTVGSNVTDPVVVRGKRLYDRKLRTFAINRPVQVVIVSGLDFEDLPQAARTFVTIKAARQFAIGRSSDAATYRFTAEEEGAALAAVEAAEDQSDDRTLFDKNRHLRSRARRRRRA